MLTFLVIGNNLENINVHTVAAKSQQAADQTLAIVVQNDGYCFCTAAGSPWQIARIYARSFANDWEGLSPSELFNKLQDTHSELKADYRQVHLTVQSTRFTPVPASVYRDGTGTDYFELVFGRIDNEQLHRDTVERLDLQLISAFPIGLSGASAIHFKPLKLYSQMAVMLNRFARIAKKAGSEMYLGIENNHLFISLFRDGQPEALNSFSIYKAEDALYFCSLLSNDKSCRIRLYGSGLLLMETKDLLAKYYESCSLLSNDDLIAFDAQLAALPAQQLQVLFACLCAS